MSSDSPSPDFVSPAQPVEPAKLLATLEDGTKIKQRILRMRACDEKNEKGKLCLGHLKRWHGFGESISQRLGRNAEIYRCERCRTLYLPNPAEVSRTGTLAW